jgi:hypothetical protein
LDRRPALDVLDREAAGSEPDTHRKADPTRTIVTKVRQMWATRDTGSVPFVSYLVVSYRSRRRERAGDGAFSNKHAMAASSALPAAD